MYHGIVMQSQSQRIFFGLINNLRTLKLFSKMNRACVNYCVKSAQIRSHFWSVFCYIRIEYGDLLRKSPYSIQIEENTDQK